MTAVFFSFLQNKIQGKKVILFGETHGTKEIPELIFSFFSEYISYADFNVGLELSSTFQEKIDEFFSSGNEEILNELFYEEFENDGRKTIEYLNFIKNIRELNIKHNKKIKIICVDVEEDFESKDFQNKREEVIAEKIITNTKKMFFVILGNIHASKKDITFPGITIIPAGKYISQKLKNQVLNINLIPKSGEFYNFSIKKVDNTISSSHGAYDYIYYVGLVSPAKVLRKK